VGVFLKALGRLVKEMPLPFPAIAASAGLLDEGAQPLKEYVGIVWVGDEPGKRVSVLASSPTEAAEKLKQQYGAQVHYSVYNEDDANRRRR
jgi:hypothetical protein